MSALSVALASARTYLNDNGAVTWTDAVLIPKAQEAHRELQTELWNAGSPVVRGQSSILALLTGVTVLSPSSTPPLPVDLINPIQLFETPHATSTWVPMTEVDDILLGQTQVATLGIWAWRGESIILVGSTNPIDIYMQYRKLLAVPAVSGDPIGIIFGETYLATRMAALAAASVANMDSHDKFTALAKENLVKVITANRGRQ